MAAAVAITLTTFWASSRHESPSYVVLNRSVPAGEPLTISDLALAPMDLHEIAVGQVYTDPAELLGSALAFDGSRGLLLNRSNLISPTAGAGSARLVTLALGSAQALDGRVQSGQRVDIVAAPRDGGASVLVGDAVVRSVSTASDSLGDQGGINVTLSVPTLADATSVLGAQQHADISLIAATGTNQ